MPDENDVRNAVQNALANVLSGVDDLLIKWAAVVEVVDSEGHRACWTLSTPGAMPWDVCGLLDYSLTIERAAIARDEDEDD